MSTKKMVFFFDQAKCVACQACEISCKVVNKLPLGVRYRKVISTAYTGTSIALRPHLSMACNHCDNPACMSVCPVDAYSKNAEGLVIHDPEKCIGCQECMGACPYHAPQFNEETELVQKCDFCADRLENGILPGCIEGCPAKALTFGYASEIASKYPDFKSVPNLKKTSPNFMVKEGSRLHTTNGKNKPEGYTGEIAEYLKDA
ncbi:anaerobic dimethyl sulfoxide reductase subunit B (DMSO reductase iron-sulfur subunit) [Desulfuromusa kysingii]|uniref:Anaerobic dimethyl sulfoxide reductase subunit B (DMSO reductase iron-sulfur subunit) n=1 Tax=Desulfuromusa kysingii TaxID=37625 RepID=A0A1H4E3W0_9BACT|nr:4Fe-4S dicluster domain-containing protein [Desulfuromusa kysingii]SEA79250.1 anaerobic dimethyl sulfoxide reductase subunit B (DMSO reductase iron-sulfur subunit) [Desulfuromusa kysingii]